MSNTIFSSSFSYDGKNRINSHQYSVEDNYAEVIAKNPFALLSWIL